jgi:FMN-dependent NADH-azoreductase
LDTAYCALGRRVERHGLVTVAPLDKLAEDPAEKRAWAQTRPLINEVLAADTVLIGAPMYNYSIPATLKAWIDRISFPGAFLDPTTGERLLSATRFVVITTRGGAYGPGTPREGFDFHQPYLRAYLGKQGVAVENMYFIAAEMTLAALAPHLARFQPLAERSLSAARAEVTELATGITQSAAWAAL